MRGRNRGPKLGVSFDGARLDERGVAVDAGLNARNSGEAFGLSIAVHCVIHVAGLHQRHGPSRSP